MPAAPAADPTDLIAQALHEPAGPGQRATSLTRRQLRYARAERDLSMPTISAVAAGGLMPAYQAPLSRSLRERAGINVNIPIFNGFLFSARHAEANLRAQAADQAHARPCRPHLARRAHGLARRQSPPSSSLDVTAQLLKQTNLALNLVQGRYKLGLAPIVEFSEAQLNLTQAQIDNTNAKYDFEIQSAALLYQTGQLH